MFATISPENRGLMRDRKRLRSALPFPGSLERIRELTAEINAKVLDHTSNLCKEVLDSIDHRANPSKLLKVVRSLHKRNSGIPAGHEAILSPGLTLIPYPREQADLWSNTMLPSTICPTDGTTAALSAASTTLQLILPFPLSSLPRWCLRASSGPASPPPKVQMGSLIPI